MFIWDVLLTWIAFAAILVHWWVANSPGIKCFILEFWYILMGWKFSSIFAKFKRFGILMGYRFVNFCGKNGIWSERFMGLWSYSKISSSIGTPSQFQYPPPYNSISTCHLTSKNRRDYPKSLTPSTQKNTQTEYKKKNLYHKINGVPKFATLMSISMHFLRW